MMAGQNMRSCSPWCRDKITCDRLLLSKNGDQCVVFDGMFCFAVSIADYCFWNQNYCKTYLERVVFGRRFVGKDFF
jgi:hypothetical protein